MELFYKYRLNLALLELGIEPNLSTSFIEGTIYFAKRDNLTPAEAAAYVYYVLPKEYQTSHGWNVIANWVVNKQIRKEVLVQLKLVAASLDKSPNDTPNYSDDLLYRKYEKQFKSMINALLEKFPNILNGIDNPLDDLMKIISISRFLAINACTRSGREISNLSTNEKYMLRFICYLITIYVARIGGIDFFAVSSHSITNLVPNEKNDEMLEHSQKIIVLHKQMVNDPEGAEYIKAIGYQVIAFIQSADISCLANLAHSYDMMCQGETPIK